MKLNKLVSCLVGVLALSAASSASAQILASPFGKVDSETKPTKPTKPPKPPKPTKPPKGELIEVVVAEWKVALNFGLTLNQNANRISQSFTSQTAGMLSTVGVNLWCHSSTGQADGDITFAVFRALDQPAIAQVSVPTAQAITCGTTGQQQWIYVDLSQSAAQVNVGEPLYLSVTSTASASSALNWVYTHTSQVDTGYPFGNMFENAASYPDHDMNFEVRVKTTQ